MKLYDFTHAPNPRKVRVCTPFATFEYATLAGVEIGAEHANLRRWHADFSARPSAKA